MPTKLILIRHGRTAWNFKKRYCGARDIGLDRAGKKEAARLYGRMKKEIVHKIYSSHKKRARQTAEIAFGTSAIKKAAGLAEIHFGVFEGLTYKQVLKKYPTVYKKWLKNPFDTVIPGGERLPDFKKRVVAAIKKIVSLNKGKTVAIVSHGGAISIFINQILGSRDFWKHIPRSASISVVEYNGGKPRIRYFNDTAHLEKK